MFGFNSNEPLPNEIISSYAAWDEYMAFVWHKLLALFSIHPDSTIVEVAPGSSNKISNALAKNVFYGDLFVVEPHKQLAEMTRYHYTCLLPRAKIHIIEERLLSALDQLPTSVDALIANHPIDDMILAHSLSNENSQQTFSWACESRVSNTNHVMQQWLMLASEPKKLQQSCDSVYEAWLHTIERLNPKLVIISQYPGYTLAKAGLHDMNSVALAVLDRIKEKFSTKLVNNNIIQPILNEMKHYNHEHIGRNVLNAENWLVISS